jgi:thioredoxin 1
MKTFFNLLAVTALMCASVAQAQFKDFSQAEYDAALAAGKTVVVDFHATWCPTCKKQTPLLNEIVAMPGYEMVVALKADYDKEKDLKKSLKVSKQSTIVVFKGGKEVARQAGLTDKMALKSLIDKGM